MGSNGSQQNAPESKIVEFLRERVCGPADGSIDVYDLPGHLVEKDDDGMSFAKTDDVFEKALNKVLKEKGGHITGVQERFPPCYLYSFD
jgi:hypothetical protein